MGSKSPDEEMWGTSDIFKHAQSHYQLTLDAGQKETVMKAIRRKVKAISPTKDGGKHFRIPAKDAVKLVEIDMEGYFSTYAPKAVQEKLDTYKEAKAAIEKMSDRKHFAKISQELDRFHDQEYDYPPDESVELAEIKAMLSCLLKEYGKTFDSKAFRDDYREAYRAWLHSYDVSADEYSLENVRLESVFKKDASNYLKDV